MARAKTMDYVSEFYDVLSDEIQGFLIDLEYIDEVVSGVVFVNSMLSVINSLGYPEYLQELADALKEYVGRLLEVLAVEGTYIPGLASFLSTKLEKRLWELDIPDSALVEFLGMLIGYRIALTRDNLSTEDSEELLRLTCHYLRISSCEELKQYLRPLTPSLAFQVALTSLAISVGGIGV